MAKKSQQEFVQHITPRSEDFSQWYTDVVRLADLMDYTPVRGCMAIKPYGYGIWELIQQQLDAEFKRTGHQNVSMPMLIPESLLLKEADHVEGFAPEVAWVTQGGTEPLAERLAVRPTSETIFCTMYAKWVQSWRDLPLKYNQWCSVMRWEKRRRKRRCRCWAFTATSAKRTSRFRFTAARRAKRKSLPARARRIPSRR